MICHGVLPPFYHHIPPWSTDSARRWSSARRPTCCGRRTSTRNGRRRPSLSGSSLIFGGIRFLVVTSCYIMLYHVISCYIPNTIYKLPPNYIKLASNYHQLGTNDLPIQIKVLTLVVSGVRTPGCHLRGAARISAFCFLRSRFFDHDDIISSMYTLRLYPNRERK